MGGLAHPGFVLFTGKGGVGKTTIASGAAVALADAGQRVLLVSTDPASNLSDVFQTTTGEDASPAPDVAGLELMDLDPQTAADAYRERVIDPYRGSLADLSTGAVDRFTAEGLHERLTRRQPEGGVTPRPGERRGSCPRGRRAMRCRAPRR